MKKENPDGVWGSSATAPPRCEPALKLDLQSLSDGTIVLRCQGRIVFSGARPLTTLVTSGLPTTGRMIVDLAGIDSVDSAGLGELVLLHMWAEAAGYSLKFAGPRPPVRNLLQLTHLASVFDIYDNVSEAAAATYNEAICSA